MLPPSPLTFPLWGAAIYVGLAAGLWRALAAPWLAPGWPAEARAAPPPQPDGGAALAPAHAAGGASEGGPAPPGRTGAGGGGKVIRVPHARWRERRG
jgi:hypothetical protein